MVSRPVEAATSAVYRSTASRRSALIVARYTVTRRSMFCAEPSTTTSPAVALRVAIRASSTSASVATDSGGSGVSSVVVGAQVGALEQQHIDIVGRVGEQPVEGAVLAAVAAEVPGVEQPGPAGLDEQGVGVERGVVGQVGGDRERADLDRLAVVEVPGFVQVDAGAPELRGAQHVGSALPDPDRDAGGQVGDQAPVVLMPVGEQHRQRRRAVLPQTDRGGSGMCSPGPAHSGRPRSSRIVAPSWRTSTQLPPISVAPRWIRTCIPLTGHPRRSG